MTLEESIQYLASSMNLLSREIDQLTRTLQDQAAKDPPCPPGWNPDTWREVLSARPLDENNLQDVLRAVGEHGAADRIGENSADWDDTASSRGRRINENSATSVAAAGIEPVAAETSTAAKKRAGRPPGARNKSKASPESMAVEKDVEKHTGEAGFESHVLEPLVALDEPEPAEFAPETSTATEPEEKKKVTHEDIRVIGREIISRGETDKVIQWVKDEFEVEAISMIPAERLEEALASIKKLV